MAATHLAGQFGAFASGIRFVDIPPAAIEAVRAGLTDFGACVFMGIAGPAFVAAKTVIGPERGGASVAVAFGLHRASPRDAALLNGLAAHASNIDDNALGNSHVSSVLASAVLAAGEARGRSGAEIAAAYVAGYEVWARLVACDEDAYVSRGWHLTTVMGPIAAAAAVASLWGLDPARSTSAIGIACSFSGGLGANFNATMKPYQVGRAAASGIEAVQLAEAGIQGSADAIEGPMGLLNAFTPKGRIKVPDSLDLGTRWQIGRTGLNVKRYANAAIHHRALDGMFELIAVHGLKAEDVAEIVVAVDPGSARLAVRPDLAPAGLNPLLSVELAMASAVLAGQVSSVEMSRAFSSREDVQALMHRVVRVEDPEAAPDVEPGLGFKRSVLVRTASGATLRAADAPVAHGHWTDRLTPDEHWTKFAPAAVAACGAEQARTLFERLGTIEMQGGAPVLPGIP
jgi:2-methylcitrate dehydratase PrpD